MKRVPISRRDFLVTGFAAAAATHPSVLMAQEPSITIGIGSDPVFSAFFLAAHEKMFAAEKVNVALRVYADGGEAMNALVAQQVNLAVGGEPTTLVRLGRAEMRPLAVIYQSGRYVKMVVGKDVSGPDKIKKFGIVPGTVSEYCAGLAMKKLALDAAQIQLVRSGPPELPALLARGDIDAYFVWEPWPTNGLRQGGRVLMTSGEAGYTSTLWLNAAAAWFGQNAIAAQSILKALAKASDIVTKDPQRAAAAVQAETKIPPAQTLAALKDMDAVVRDFSDADVESFEGIAQFLAQQKVTQGAVDFRRVLQRGFFKG